MTVFISDAPLPALDPVVEVNEKKQGFISIQWSFFLTTLLTVLNRCLDTMNTVNLTSQSASLPTTDASGGSVNNGLYEIRYYGQISRPATTNSSLTVTVAWTANGVAMSSSSAAVTGNTVNSFTSGSVPLAYCDANTPISYSTTYASTGATSMLYNLSVTVGKVRA